MHINRRLILLPAFFIIILSASSATQTIYNPAASGKLYFVETIKYEWQDAKRNRPVPVKIYHPVTEGESLPVIIFSHGLGGSRDGYDTISLSGMPRCRIMFPQKTGYGRKKDGKQYWGKMEPGKRSNK